MPFVVLKQLNIIKVPFLYWHIISRGLSRRSGSLEFEDPGRSAFNQYERVIDGAA